jgi:uncharacterized protein (DUF1800 family)
MLQLAKQGRPPNAADGPAGWPQTFDVLGSPSTLIRGAQAIGS